MSAASARANADRASAARAPEPSPRCHPTAPAGDDTSAAAQPSALGGAGPGTEAAPPGLAQLHQHTFGTDVLRCPCGGRRTIRGLHSTRKQAEARLAELGLALPSRVLPPATAPPQLLLPM